MAPGGPSAIGGAAASDCGCSHPHEALSRRARTEAAKVTAPFVAHGAAMGPTPGGLGGAQWHHAGVEQERVREHDHCALSPALEVATDVHAVADGERVYRAAPLAEDDAVPVDSGSVRALGQEQEGALSGRGELSLCGADHADQMDLVHDVPSPRPAAPIALLG